MHRHKAIESKSQDFCYAGPINGARENRAAHGNICRHDYCSCGAVRMTNINGWHEERGQWVTPEMKELRA